MTTVATGTKRTVVNIVIPMTGDTAPLFVLQTIAIRMAILAPQFAMPPLQWEVRLFIVIKDPCGPCVRVVAITTCAFQCPLVNIIGFMTFVAGGVYILEICRLMTSLAGCKRVLPDQGKTAEIVIETDLFHPAPLVVAIITMPPLPAFMYVVQAMAVVTC